MYLTKGNPSLFRLLGQQDCVCMCGIMYTIRTDTRISGLVVTAPSVSQASFPKIRHLFNVECEFMMSHLRDCRCTSAASLLCAAGVLRPLRSGGNRCFSNNSFMFSCIYSISMSLCISLTMTITDHPISMFPHYGYISHSHFDFAHRVRCHARIW